MYKYICKENFPSNSIQHQNGAIRSAGQGMKTKKGIISQEHDRPEKKTDYILNICDMHQQYRANVMQHAEKGQICFAMAY